MNKVSDLTLKQFNEWFDSHNVSDDDSTESIVKKLTAWAAWQEAYDRGYADGTSEEKLFPTREREK